MSWKTWLSLLILAILLGLGGWLLPLKDWFLGMLAWIQALGWWGPGVFVGVYVLACVFLLPGSLLTIGAGFVFGLGLGTAVVSAGSTLGATLAFVIGRTMAREWIAKKVAGNPTFDAIDEAIGRSGLKLVLLLRLSPLFPFNILNYALGLTRVRPGSYVLGSWLGMVPGTILYVYLGSAARSLAEIASGQLAPNPAQQVLFWAGLAASVLAAAMITRVARKSLRAAANTNAKAEGEAEA
jgi:uncharacterized membrane protein YdjX (TVP38/TMEM64 family)